VPINKNKIKIKLHDKQTTCKILSYSEFYIAHGNLMIKERAFREPPEKGGSLL
jgi:hypothetical protein